jgi:hypothetical protein
MYDVVVTPCSGSATSFEWCCGGTNDCCKEGSNIARFTIPLKFGDLMPTLSASSSFFSSPSPTATSISSSSISPTATHGSQPSSKDGWSTGAKAGTGIGVAAGVIICVVIGILAGRSRQRQKVTHAPAYEIQEQYAAKEVYRFEDDMGRAQLPATENQVHELPGIHGAELPASQGAGWPTKHGVELPSTREVSEVSTTSSRH